MNSVLIPVITITINLSMSVGIVDPRIYGMFLEHVQPDEKIIYGGIFDFSSQFADEMGLRKDVIESLKEMGVPVIRWPGGIFADSYHWRDGVGERSLRPWRDNWWGGSEPNQFGTDEYLKLCELLESSPYICLNAGTGTPNEAAEWVEYCKERGVTGALWGIGNEMYGSWEPGHCSASEYAERFLEFAHRVREVDPGARLVAVGAPHLEWNDVVMSRVSSGMDYLSIHMYAHSDEDAALNYWNVVGAPIAFEEAIQAVIGQIRNHGLEDRVKLAVDEWNVRHMVAGKIDRKDPRNLQDALFVAGVLNVFQRLSRHVGVANYVFMVNGHAPLLVDGDRVLKTPLYHVFLAYQRYCHPYAVMATSNSPTQVAIVRDIGGWPNQGEKVIPLIDVSATTDRKGHLTVSILNRAQERVRITLEIPNVELGTGMLWTLAGDSPLMSNTWDEPEAITPRILRLEDPRSIVVEPYSINLLMVDYEG